MLDFEETGPGLLGAGMIAPYVVCATCGQRITNGQANAVFEVGAAWKKTGRFMIVHRGECDPREGPWQPLPELLIQLLHNSGYDMDQICRDIDRMRETGRRWREEGIIEALPD
jgi:hypothetical protein